MARPSRASDAGKTKCISASEAATMAQTPQEKPPSVHREDRPPKLVLVDPIEPNRGARGGEEIRVLIAYGDKLARAGLHSLLGVEPGIVVAGSAADGEEAIALAAQIRPAVVVIDMTLPGIAGREVARRLVADPDTSGVRVLILSGSEQDDEVLSCLRAGASGFLPADTEPAELADCIRAVAAGEVALSPGALRWVIGELASQPDPQLPGPQQLDELTPREREVMALVAAGLSNDEIAAHLVISWRTAKTHVSRALRKLHARDRAQLVTLAYETGLVLPKMPTAAGFGVPAATFATA
jgi:DNA-binding NarL/FixJ family response regulator